MKPEISKAQFCNFPLADTPYFPISVCKGLPDTLTHVTGSLEWIDLFTAEINNVVSSRDKAATGGHKHDEVMLSML